MVTEYEEKFKDLSRYAPLRSQGEEALARKSYIPLGRSQRLPEGWSI